MNFRYRFGFESYRRKNWNKTVHPIFGFTPMNRKEKMNIEIYKIISEQQYSSSIVKIYFDPFELVYLFHFSFA